MPFFIKESGRIAMIQSEAGLWQTIEQLERMYRVVAELRKRMGATDPAQFRLFAEGPIDATGKLRHEIRDYLGVQEEVDLYHENHTIHSDGAMAINLQLITGMYRAILSLRRDIAPLNHTNYLILAQGPVEHIRRLQLEIDEYLGIADAVAMDEPRA